MFVKVVDFDSKLPTKASWSKKTERDHSSFVDHLVPIVDHNSVTFCYFYSDEAISTTFVPVETFVERVKEASETFKHMDFQLITFNVPENEKFKHVMAALGFTLLGDSNGGHGTPVFLYVKTKGV
jgi:regulatory protein YycH of two-component signal transduction system YycFG